MYLSITGCELARAECYVNRDIGGAMFLLLCLSVFIVGSDSCDDDGRVDWSQWNGELTQSSAACNRKVQPLLRKNRELRGLVLDDPPDNTGLPEFSYARGRRGYTKPAGAQPCVQLVESPYSSSKMLSETPARTPTPPVQPPSPPAATSVCHSIRGSVYSFEVGQSPLLPGSDHAPFLTRYGVLSLYFLSRKYRHGTLPRHLPTAMQL